MSIPDYETSMLPILKFARDGNEDFTGETREFLCKEFAITEEERKRLLPSGGTRVIVNRTNWALVYLRKCQLLESTRRGHFRIRERGVDVLNQSPERIDCHFLEQFPEYHEFKKGKPTIEQKRNGDIDMGGTRTPEEIIGELHQELNSSLAEELINKIKSSSPSFFEVLVIDLLVRMVMGGRGRMQDKQLVEVAMKA